MILGGGFSGIVAITWAVEFRRKMRGRSSAGKLFGDISHRSSATANLAILRVGDANAKRYFIGPTTVASFNAT